MQVKPEESCQESCLDSNQTDAGNRPSCILCFHENHKKTVSLLFKVKKRKSNKINHTKTVNRIVFMIYHLVFTVDQQIFYVKYSVCTLNSLLLDFYGLTIFNFFKYLNFI
jgi:hypothetical protein